MKFIRFFLLFFLAISAYKCSNTVGPSCTNWVTQTCYDYSSASSSYQAAAEQLCYSSFGIWSKSGCPYSNCGSADANGQITCTGP